MRNKYRNKKTEINGIVFDSKAESEYYLILLDRKQKGEIKDFELQPRFLLQKGFKKNGTTYKPIFYIADFRVFNHDGSIEIIDVKGVETEGFKLKRKMFEYVFPDLSLTIVKGDEFHGQAVAIKRGGSIVSRESKVDRPCSSSRKRKQRVNQKERQAKTDHGANERKNKKVARKTR